jgi:hypothetical protein
MTEFVIDVNDFTPYLPPSDLPSGVTGLIAKATEGSDWKSTTFSRYLADCQAAAIPFMAYHFLHHDEDVPAQVANVQSMVPTSVPVTIDVEPESSLGNYPTADDALNMVHALRAAGYWVPVIYFPEWYWSQLGEPSLADLPPLWASRYVSGSGPAWTLYQSVPTSWWDGYGNDTIALLQFTDSYTTNGGAYDCSAVPGSFAQLITRPITPPTQEEEMPGLISPFTVDATHGRAYASFEVGSTNSRVINSLWVACKALWGDINNATVVFTGDIGQGIPAASTNAAGNPTSITSNHRLYWQAPNGASDVTIEWDTSGSTGILAPYLVWN